MSSDLLHGLWRTALCGSEEQKLKYLHSLAQFSAVACWVSGFFWHSATTCVWYVFMLDSSYFMVFWSLGFDRAWLWKWCKWSENNSNKGLTSWPLLCYFYVAILHAVLLNFLLCLAFALILGFSGGRRLDTRGQKTLDRKQYLCRFACCIRSQYHY
jgi:hypothetical protein